MGVDTSGLLKRAVAGVPGWRSWFGGRFHIGLDLGPDRLNMVQMRRVNGRLAIRAAASVPYGCSREELSQDPQRLRALLKAAHAAHPFKGRRVVSCLPTGQMKIITVSFREVEGEPDAVPIVAELRDRYKGELDQMVVDFMPLRQESTEAGKRNALVALAPRESVKAYLDLLTGAGLDVVALDVGPAALTRVVACTDVATSPRSKGFANVLLINFGSRSSYLTVVWGRRLMLDRAVEFCEQRLFARLQRLLDMPEELAVNLLYRGAAASPAGVAPGEIESVMGEVLRPEFSQLMQEINKTLVYMASRTRGGSVDQIFLAGRVAMYPGLREMLNLQLKVPVAILNPIEVFSSRDGGAGHGDLASLAGIALTTGLALRGVRRDA